MHQPWRTFATIINRCISRKTTGLDKLRLSRAQILWEMYHNKNVDFFELLWEDFAFQIDNHFSKESMSYPRFTKIIINHFISQNKSISMRNRINLHTARDDSLLGTLKYVSKTEEHQVYGALIPTKIINEDILNSTSYKTYYAYASVSSKEPTKKPGKAKKDVTSTKKTSTKPKPTKKKAPVKADRGDGTNFESGVPDEKQRNISGTDKGTGAKPGIPDVPKYDYESDKESWGDSGEEDNDDEYDTEDDDDNDGNNDDDNDDDDNDNDDKEYVDEFTDKEDDDDNAKEETEEDLDDAEELYRDVNVNLRKEDVEMTDADQGEVDQHNISQESGFKQEEEDAHVTLTAVRDIQNTKGLMQSSSVSFDFTKKLLNFENVSPADNEIASLMDTIVHHEEPSGQSSSLFTIPITVIPVITSAFTTTIPPPPPSFNPLPQQATPTPTPIVSEETTLFPALPDFSYVFRFNDRVTNLERDLSEMKQVDQYAQAISSIPVIVDRYIDNKLREGIQQAIKSHTAECREDILAAGGELIYKKELYDALVKSYNTDKDLIDTYGEVFSLKRSRDDKDKDQDPSAGSGSEGRKEGSRVKS
ncbi:hypothetical protein Tco_1112934 [Tanacetum coccineum]|uniref:Uncharacterized protein n=1 Tax=Tanacetum coccineum TaxID=301880 RepID=A0ABQ5IR86_9ASTR